MSGRVYEFIINKVVGHQPIPGLRLNKFRYKVQWQDTLMAQDDYYCSFADHGKPAGPVLCTCSVPDGKCDKSQKQFNVKWEDTWVTFDYLCDHKCQDMVFAYIRNQPQPAQDPIVRPPTHRLNFAPGPMPALEEMPPLPLRHRFSDSDFSIDMPTGSKYNPIVV